MNEGAPRQIAIGGMDADIEHLLLDAVGAWPEAVLPQEPPVPWATLTFAGRAAGAGQIARRVCGEHGWTAQWCVRGPKAQLWVQDVVVSRLVAHLARNGIAPDTVDIRGTELPPAQVRAIREVLPAGTRLVIDAVSEDELTFGW